MSRSILKNPDKRLIPVPANEGVDSDCESRPKVQPWAPVDDEPMMMGDMQHEVNRMQRDIQKMHQQMMSSFPGPPPPLESLLVPPFQPITFPNMPGHMVQPMLPGPSESHLMPHRNGSPGLRAIKDMSPPSGSLKRNHEAVVPASGPMAMNPAHFGPVDLRIPPPPVMPMMPMGPPPGAAAPVITEDEYGYRDMELILDVKGFMPEDIHIHTEGKVLQIHAIRLCAKHDISHGGVQEAQVAKECRRQYTLPEVVRAENLRCYVNHKGQLTIEGPLGPDIMRIRNKKKVKFVPNNK